MAWAYRKNARHRNPKKDAVWKAVRSNTKRKTKNEMVGWRVHGPEKDGYKWMERQSKEPRDLEAYCSGDQGPPPAVAPSGGGIYTFLFFTARDPSAQNSRSAYKSLRFITDKPKLRRTLNTTRKKFIINFCVFENIKYLSGKRGCSEMCHFYAQSFCHSTLPPLRT